VADFYVWVTATTEASADRLVAALVREAYTVSPLASTGKLTVNGELSSVIALKLSKTLKDDKDAQKEVLDVVKKIYEKMGATYHSIIISHLGGSCQWAGSNIKPLPSTKTAYDRLNEDEHGDEKKDE
jgi:hypothetical protein